MKIVEEPQELGAKIINLTGKDVTIAGKTFKASGHARLRNAAIIPATETIQGVPVLNTWLTKQTDLPEERDGIFCIVSLEVARALCSYRDDLLTVSEDNQMFLRW